MIADKISPHTIMFGCDPEFFFQKNGKIVGSEKIIDIKKGMKVNGSNSKLIVDGVQAEINPVPNTCRQVLAGEISRCMIQLYKEMSKDKDLSLNFNPTIKVTKEELKSLDEKSRVFGCAPSRNINPKSRNAVKIRDPKTYMYRSAGGHIHIGRPQGGYGIQGSPNDVTAVLREPERTIAIMDIIIGNTCVLLDRDPGNKERRKVYGKAGEFRTPAHGLEYRTLSNFWLRSYPLMSFVMNLARFSVSIMASTMPGRDFEKELLSMVKMSKIHQAINNNDAELAWDNFQRIKPFIAQYTTQNQDFPLTVDNMEKFEFFVSKGLDYWFKEDPLQHWINLGSSGAAGEGWETFLKNKVMPQMMAEKPSPLPVFLKKKTTCKELSATVA